MLAWHSRGCQNKLNLSKDTQFYTLRRNKRNGWHPEIKSGWHPEIKSELGPPAIHLPPPPSPQKGQSGAHVCVCVCSANAAYVVAVFNYGPDSSGLDSYINQCLDGGIHSIANKMSGRGVMGKGLGAHAALAVQHNKEQNNKEQNKTLFRGSVSRSMKCRILKSRKALREKYPMIGGISYLDHVKLANKWGGENCPQCNTPMSDPWTQMGDYAGFCDDCCCGGCGSRKAYPGQCHC